MSNYPPLSQDETCRVYRREQIVFTSRSHWLHPLFELKEFLEENDIPAEELYLKDRVIGRGAALMIAKLGIPRGEAPLVSERALPVLKENGISFAYGKTVSRLECMTEDVLADITDPDRAWTILEERARKAREARR